MKLHPLAVLPLLAIAPGAAAQDVELARIDPELAARTRSELPAAPPAPTLDLAFEQLPPGARGASDATAGAFTVEYTTDAALEAELGEILARGGIGLGQVIAMDPDTGEVFAYVATDPDAFPATRTYPTASLMKVVTAAAVLRAAPAAAARPCRYLGSPYALEAAQLAAPARGGQVDTFEDAIAISNNQCFARLAVRDVGRDALVAEIERVGMLEPPAPGHPAGSVAAIEDDLALGRLGSGLAGSSLSPLAAVRLAAALARGELLTPWWIAGVRDAGGLPVAGPERPEPERIWPPDVARALRAALRSVTERGTAKRAFRNAAGEPLLGAVEVAGKTGTLRGEDPEGLYQWFIGVAPADRPRVAVAAVVVHDLTARGELTSAAQVAAETLQALFCDGAGCAGARVEELHARARARDAAWAEELEAHRLERERARAAAQRVEPARLLDSADLELPRWLRRRKVEGEIVLLVSVAPSGDVADVEVDDSDLPRFEEFVAEQVRTWRFSPMTRGGRPLASQVRLRIPIRVE